MKRDFKKAGLIALESAKEKKAVDPLLLDLRRESDIADFALIATAESSAQLRAIGDAIEDALGVSGLRLLRRDARVGSRWIALDYGGLVVHILTTEAREFYRLEQLWEERAKEVGTKPRKKKRK